MAFGRDFLAAFFIFFDIFFAFGYFAPGAAGLSHIGARVGAGTGAGEGAEGNIGSEKPGPGQLLSV